MIFEVFVESKGKAILGAGMRHSFLQRSTQGKVGDRLDAFKENEWLDLTREKLRRARSFQGFSLNR